MSPEEEVVPSVTEFYKQKNVLLTGATGFIGKAILYKLIKSLGQDIGQVYLLMRSGSNKRTKIGSPVDRLKNEILNNKAFLLLRKRMGSELFDSIIDTKIKPISGNLISPDLSLSDRESITDQVNIVIHCAATIDYNERLDLALETNTLGTLRMIDLADGCKNIEAFVYISLAYLDSHLSDGHVQERVYPMFDDAERLLGEIVNLELDEIPKMTQRILEHYPNTYTFTKALTEHLILRRVDSNRIEQIQGGNPQFPVAIVRATQVGAGVHEPLPGWVDGVTGANSTLFLMGKGVQVFPVDTPATLTTDIVPVDHLARVIIACASTLKKPGQRFMLPYNEIVNPGVDINVPDIEYFPIIYQVTGKPLFSKVDWRFIYQIVLSYWHRNGKTDLPHPNAYFTTNKSLFKAKFFIRQFANKISPVDQTIELASRVVQAMHPFLRHDYTFDHQNLMILEEQLKGDDTFGIDTVSVDWDDYITNYCFGLHACNGADLRNISVPKGWTCALYSKRHEPAPIILDKQIESIVFSMSDIHKRTERMLEELVLSLENPSRELKDKKKMEDWVNDFDASLDDWCHQDEALIEESKHVVNLGHWLDRSESHEEHVTVEVLNDKRVGEAIRQIVESSGVPQKTVVSEALKILQRMRERTELYYIWSAGALLNALFKRLFDSIRIEEADIDRLKKQINGKHVVYAPVSKTMMDPLLLWYVCLRFDLPVPALVCDEALALLGPISDILRIAGAYFVRRNRESRSPLSTAVTAAYTEVMLRKHGAISIMIEKARSRTGRVQSAYHDGLINMVVEGTVQNEEPTVIVPINITYERIPELRSLVAQVLDQKQTKAAESKKNEGKYGRAFIGFGEAFDLGDAVTEASLSKQKRASTIPVKDEDAVADFIAHKVQRGQQNASVLSPTTLVAATLLFGRTHGGISLKDIYKHVSWLRDEIMLKEIHLDWQADEEVSTIVSYAFKLLDANENLTLDGKRMTPQTVVGVVDHVDNVMCLSYNASQLIEIFLPESLLSMVYLSIKDKTTRDELLRKFTFLVRLFKHEFIYPWKREETFGKLLDWFIKKGLLVHTDGDQEQYERVVSIENNQEEYTRVCLLASLIYPTLDAYWVTSCSLSVLCNLPYMPRKIVPVLSQWIAAHLIAGRRTIYREVLSTEASQNALDNLLAIGFIDAVHPKEKLSPDAQILLLELGVVTNEDLVMVSDRENNDHNDDPEDNDEDMDENCLSKLKDVASLCHEIEKYRYDQVNLPYNLQVFEKCQSQIKSILRLEKSFAKQRGVQLPKEEDQMIQLVYSLKVAINAPLEDGAESRRISQAYNI